jgi:tetratricopeptide (TPR) repeat protein
MKSWWRDRWARFEQFVIEREQANDSMSAVLLCLAGIVAVRTLFEPIVADNPIFEGLACFLHYPLAYLAPFLALTWTLAIWSQVPPLRVARLMIWAWLLTLLPPLLDLVLHHHREIPTIGYFRGEPSDLPLLLMSFFDPRAELPGTTSGIRLETLSAVILGAIYIAMRSRSLARAIGGAFQILIVSLGFFTLPVLVLSISRWFDPRIELETILRHVGIVWRGAVGSAPDAAALLWLVPVIGLLLWAWARLERKAPQKWFTREAWSARLWSQLAPIGLMLAANLLIGVRAARWLQFGEIPSLITAPFDWLAISSALIAIFTAVLTLGAPAPVRWVLAFGVTCYLVALDRPFALPTLAAIGALLPWSLSLVTERWSSLAAAIGVAIASFASFAAGFCLLIGPDGLARLPLSVAIGAAGVGGVLGWVVARHGIGLWPQIALLTLGFVAATGAIGAWPVAIIGAAGAFLSSAISRLLESRVGARATPLVLTSLVAATNLMVFEGTIRHDQVRPRLEAEVRCVAKLMRLKGEEYAGRGQWGPAATSFSQALECDPQDVGSLRQLGLIARNVDNKLERARDYFERAVEADPRSVQEWTNLAGIRLDLGDFVGALAATDTGLALARRDPRLLFNRATALTRLERLAPAREAWQQYLKIAQSIPAEREAVNKAKQELQRLTEAP